MKNKVHQGQSFFDKAIEITGSIDNAFALAYQNNFSITDALVIGTNLQYTGAVNTAISNLFTSNTLCATATTPQNLDLITNQGIGTMIIQATFIVG